MLASVSLRQSDPEAENRARRRRLIATNSSMLMEPPAVILRLANLMLSIYPSGLLLGHLEYIISRFEKS